MKKAQYSQRGPVPQDVIDVVEFDKPTLAAGQALVEVLASPINPSDVLTLTGEYGVLPELPAVGGNEGVGRIVELAPDVQGWQVGQTVMLPISSGTWSTHLVAAVKTLVPLPSGVDPKQLAMVTVNPPTALLMLTEVVELQPGDWVIQNAANSAVGTYLIQLAKARGLKTVNVVRRESAVAGVKDVGGDVVLVDGDDLGKRARDAAGVPIKLGIDAVGGVATQHIAQALGEGGIVLNYGAMSGEACSISPASFIFRDVSLRGFWLARWFKAASSARRAEVFGEIGKLIATGQLAAKIHATYGLDQIKEAVAAAAQGERDGKILILPNGPV